MTRSTSANKRFFPEEKMKAEEKCDIIDMGNILIVNELNSEMHTCPFENMQVEESEDNTDDDDDHDDDEANECNIRVPYFTDLPYPFYVHYGCGGGSGQ